MLDDATRIRAAIDQVPEENQVGLGRSAAFVVRFDAAQQVQHEVEAAMNVADGICPATGRAFRNGLMPRPGKKT